MKIKPGQKSVKLPPIGQLIEVRFASSLDNKVVISPLDYSLWIIPPNEFERRVGADDQAIGLPTYATILADQLAIYPTPYLEGELSVKYFPPAAQV